MIHCARITIPRPLTSCIYSPGFDRYSTFRSHRQGLRYSALRPADAPSSCFTRGAGPADEDHRPARPHETIEGSQQSQDGVILDASGSLGGAYDDAGSLTTTLQLTTTGALLPASLSAGGITVTPSSGIDEAASLTWAAGASSSWGSITAPSQPALPPSPATAWASSGNLLFQLAMEGRGGHISSAAPSPAGECQQPLASNSGSSHIHTSFTDTASYDNSRLPPMSPAISFTPADRVVQRQPSRPAAYSSYGSGAAAMHQKIKIVRGFATYFGGQQHRLTIQLGIAPPPAGTAAACKRISAQCSGSSSWSPFPAPPPVPRIPGHTAVDAGASISGTFKGLFFSLDGPNTLPPVAATGRGTAGAFQPAVASQLRQPAVEAMAMSTRAGPAGQPMLRTVSLSSLGMAPPRVPPSSGPTLLLMTRSSSLGSSWTTNPDGLLAASSCGGSPSATAATAGGFGWYICSAISQVCCLLDLPQPSCCCGLHPGREGDLSPRSSLKRNFNSSRVKGNVSFCESPTYRD